MVCFSAFFGKTFEFLLPSCEQHVCVGVRHPSVRSSESEYSGKVGVTLLRVNFMVLCIIINILQFTSTKFPNILVTS